MTFRARIALSVTCLVAIVLLLFSTLTLTLVRRTLFASVDEALRVYSAQLVTMVELEHDFLELEGSEDGHYEVPLDESSLVRLLSTEGTVVDSKGMNGVPVLAQDLQPSSHLSNLTVNHDDQQIQLRIITLPVFAKNGTLVAYFQVGENLATINATLESLRQSLLILAPICVLIAAALSLLLAGRALAPVERIRRIAESTSSEHFQQDLDLDLPDDEVGRLAETFRQMLHRLSVSFSRQKRFAADASHELRTPISVVRNVVEVALNQPRSEQEYVQALEAVQVQTQGMTRLVQSLLFLARSDDDRMKLDLQSVDLLDVLSPLEELYGEVKVRIEITSALQLKADKDKLLQVFLNLLENVRIHAPGSELVITGVAKDGKAQLTFRDDGPGIAREHLTHLTDRFYRVDEARNREAGSSGLGLSIALEIIEAHRGRLNIESSLGQGTEVFIELPLLNPN